LEEALEIDFNYRNDKYRGYSREMSDLPEKRNEAVNKLGRSVSPTDFTDSTSLDPPEANYILSCPRLHQISYSKIKSLIEQDRGQTGLKVRNRCNLL
jgi:hypothetical protein